MFASKATRTGVQLPSPPGFARDGRSARSLSRRSGAKPDTSRSYNANVASYAPASHSATMAFTYVYILQSEVDPDRFYTGSTTDLRERLKRHNDGRVPHTSKWKPWTLKTYIVLADAARAAELERYLKSHSGRAFVKKHL